MVYQEMLCFPNLSVAANIFSGREISRYGRLAKRAMRRADARRCSIACTCRSIRDALAESLSAAHRQLLQVARALAFECRILVLDEPTTALTDAEADHLFDVLRELKRGGTTILYVSHRLPEVFRLCDRITVLRDGALRRDVRPRRTSRRATSSARWSAATCRRDAAHETARVRRGAEPALGCRRTCRARRTSATSR